MALKSLGSSLLNFLVADEQPQPAHTAVPTQQAGVQKPSEAQPEKLDEAVLEHLRSKALKRETPFTSLLSSAEKLKDFIPEEQRRLQAAAKTSGCDKQAVLKSIELHLSDLDVEAANFKSFIDGQYKDEVAKSFSLVDEAAEVAKTGQVRIEALRAEIKQLEETIAKAIENTASLQREAEAFKAKLHAKNASFNQALAIVKAELEQQKTTLTANL